ncbi:hypothetical protein AAZX31_07G136600 [Glycine max]|uniref:ELM2 domain-containing protein n=3 Tax=Glycine subgen. Soja TaxID=1462606 RepID=A0A0R0J9K2_SOYBN|nr:hypothetical protein GLYMA_07G145600v4 [Glycine max]RZC02939.1 AT-rich interactive domain-containing protein 1 [Glycine soja]KAH1086865.1 hypothetical protein GYH30_018414 [Glycine max]KAH1086866.1 hypothetical protein GYH30_018414 [Glycine max]KAH1241991.1 AT-rich interactive domain-containing protein 1 [Glycine max]
MKKQAFGSEDILEPNKSSHQRPRNQMHKIDTLSIPNAKCAKRKLDQYMCGHKVATDLGLITREKCSNQNAILNEKVEQCSICRQDYPQLGVSDALIEGPNPKQGYLENHRKDLVTSCNYVTTTETSMEKSNMEFSKALEPLFNGDFDNSSETSVSSSSENEDKELSQPPNNLSSEDNHIPRPVIPIGPRFQVEVPKWEGTTNVRHHHSDDDLKWLGIQLFPTLNISENKTKDIGEGRHDSCSCKFPGSVDCVELHVRETRELLKLEIGTTFSSWKYDEMGKVVSKSWTSEEQKKFESL